MPEATSVSELGVWGASGAGGQSLFAHAGELGVGVFSHMSIFAPSLFRGASSRDGNTPKLRPPQLLKLAPLSPGFAGERGRG